MSGRSGAAPPADRIAALDLIRGVAVLGILAVNIAGFAGPLIATTTPNLPHPGTGADELAFAASFLVFEGKMRALFTILFGASMVLFMERAEAAGRDAEPLQLRRLGWLALFGYLHFALIWWGDILFTYALCGAVAVFCWRAPSKPLVALALVIFALYHVQEMVSSLPDIAAEQAVANGSATARQATDQHRAMRFKTERMERELRLYRGSWPAMTADKLTEQRFWPLAVTLAAFCETLPLMLIGMALFRSGFFSGTWPAGRLRALAAGGLITGGSATAAALAWAWPRHFPPVAMNALLAGWLALPHLLMALAYAALLMLAAPRLLESRLGTRLGAAGRMAFTNYIATSLVMTAAFYGWGLGLFGAVAPAAQWLFVLLGWALMLAWSKPWLARFAQGPLEWLWRSLTQWRFVALRR
ncbi:MAG: DUF418 domain-containing protein [Novosphingobium sp.]